MRISTREISRHADGGFSDPIEMVDIASHHGGKTLLQRSSEDGRNDFAHKYRGEMAFLPGVGDAKTPLTDGVLCAWYT